jgi:hypothetical protein
MMMLGAADRGPAASVVAEAVLQVQHRELLFRLSVVGGRRVDVEIAIVADDCRMIEMAVQAAPGRVREFPRKAGSRHMHLARPEQIVGLAQVVGRVHDAHAVHDEGVTVVIRVERTGGERPDALLVLGHRGGLGNAFELEQHRLGVGRAQAEGDGAVRRDLR